MNWLNIELSTLRSEEFLGSEPVDRATWLCLMAFCADQENGGIIKDATKWGNRKLTQLMGVEHDEIRTTNDLFRLKGDDLHVWGYPKDKEKEVRRLRKQSRSAAQKRWAKMPEGIPKGIPKGNGVGNAEVEVEVELEVEKEKKNKKTRVEGFDENGNPAPPDLPESFSYETNRQ